MRPRTVPDSWARFIVNLVWRAKPMEKDVATSRFSLVLRTTCAEGNKVRLNRDLTLLYEWSANMNEHTVKDLRIFFTSWLFSPKISADSYASSSKKRPSFTAQALNGKLWCKYTVEWGENLPTGMRPVRDALGGLGPMKLIPCTYQCCLRLYDWLEEKLAWMRFNAGLSKQHPNFLALHVIPLFSLSNSKKSFCHYSNFAKDANVI